MTIIDNNESFHTEVFRFLLDKIRHISHWLTIWKNSIRKAGWQIRMIGRRKKQAIVVSSEDKSMANPVQLNEFKLNL